MWDLPAPHVRDIVCELQVEYVHDDADCVFACMAAMGYDSGLDSYVPFLRQATVAGMLAKWDDPMTVSAMRSWRWAMIHDS